MADLGGWTDTWFARTGCVLNVAVEPGVDVTLRARSCRTPSVRIRAENIAADYRYAQTPPGRHPLLEAAVESARPDRTALDLTIRSAMPPGAGTGTSAAVVVAIIGALDALAGHQRPPNDLASAAHRVEVEALGGESGVQDQIAAAYGGINDIEIVEYPAVEVRRVAVEPQVWRMLDEQLVLVYLARAHDSSAVHAAVIAGLRDRSDAVLDELRAAARAGRDALVAGDLRGFGRALIANSEAQRRLHPALISAEAATVFAAAAECGALGWKVNGAGGDGGSVAVLVDETGPHRLIGRLAGVVPGARVIPTSLSSDGIRSRRSAV
jgi:D-glycero-alpha-D-manno-heptose-7-phosphate kinase